MPFDNPYFPSQFDVGTAGAGHMHFSNNGSMTLYGPDGVTVLFSLDPVNGVQAFKGKISGPVFETVPFTVPFQSGFVRIGEAAAVGPGRPDIVELWPTIAFTPSQPAFLQGEHSVSNGFDVVGARFDSGWPGVSQLTRGIVQVGSGSDARPQDSYAALTALSPTTNGANIAAYGDSEVIARADITRLQDWSNPHKEASWNGTTFAVNGNVAASGDGSFGIVHVGGFDVELLAQGNGVNGQAGIYLNNYNTDPITVNTGGMLYVKGGTLLYRSPLGNIRTVASA